MDRPIGHISRPFWSPARAVQERLSKRTILGMLSAIVLLSWIGFLYVDQEAAVEETRAAIEDLRILDAELRREFRILQGDMARKQSVSQVIDQAAKLGLRPAGTVMTLTILDPEPAPQTRRRAMHFNEGSNEEHWLLVLAGWLESQVGLSNGRESPHVAIVSSWR